MIISLLAAISISFSAIDFILLGLMISCVKCKKEDRN
jgi:hypothetical protein